MGLYLDDDIRNAAGDASTAQLNTGAGTYPLFKIQTSGDVDLVSINLASADAVGAFSEGQGVIAPPPDAGGSWVDYESTILATGEAAKAVLCDKDGDSRIQLTVGTSGTEVVLPAISLVSGAKLKFSTAPVLNQP